MKNLFKLFFPNDKQDILLLPENNFFNEYIDNLGFIWIDPSKPFFDYYYLKLDEGITNPNNKRKPQEPKEHEFLIKRPYCNNYLLNEVYHLAVYKDYFNLYNLKEKKLVCYMEPKPYDKIIADMLFNNILK